MEEIWPILGVRSFGEGLAVQRKAEGEWSGCVGGVRGEGVQYLSDLRTSETGPS